MKRLLVLGSTGQIGWELRRSLATLGEVIALDRSGGARLPNGSTACGDLTQLDALAETVRALRPDAVINAAAYTAVDKAETERDVARTVNTLAPGVLAGACADIEALLVHYSTDYVFDGSGEAPWREDDRASPLNAYGETKMEGEQRIRTVGCRHLIMRTSWVYASRGSNFIKTVLRLSRERDALNVIDDQFGAPTGADLLADVTAYLLRSVSNRDDLCGTYHVTAKGITTWFDYARLVIEQLRIEGQSVMLAENAIAPIPSSAYAMAARRPHNSRLDCSKLERAFCLHLPPWEDGVRRAVAEMTTN